MSVQKKTVKTTLEWWDSRQKASGIQTITYNKYPVSRLMQNKWHLTFLERFSIKIKPTSGVIWVDLPFLLNPLVDFGDWHLFWTVRANRIQGEIHLHVNIEESGWCTCSLPKTESYVTLWKTENLAYCWWIISNHFKVTQTHWINHWINLQQRWTQFLIRKTAKVRLFAVFAP